MKTFNCIFISLFFFISTFFFCEKANSQAGLYLDTPTDHATGISCEVHFVWLDPNNYYDMFLLEVLNGSNIVYSVQTGNFWYNMPYQALYDNTHYIWHVAGRPKGSGIFGNFTNPWDFTTGPRPSSPDLLDPANNATNVNIPVYFDWMFSSLATHWHLFIADNYQFNGQTEIQCTANNYTWSGALANTHYFWKVRPDGVSMGWVSNTREFTTMGGGGTPALQENFELTTFPPTGWTIDFLGTNLWSRGNVSAYGGGNGSAKFDFFNAAVGTHQIFYTTTCIPSVTGQKLVFNYAYATFQTEVDTLHIWASINGGSNYTYITSLYGGPTVGQGMVTAPPSSASFTPTSAQWGVKYITIPVGTNKIAFGAYSAYGNNLYIDNVLITNGIGISKIGDNVPTEYKLLQNYPNPFNPVTKMRFELPKTSNVSIKIYDMLGKEIETLVNGKYKSGIYETDWDGTKYSSGVYFYKLKTDGFTATKKMILIK